MKARLAKTPRGMTLMEIIVALMIATVLFAAVVTSAGAITGQKAKGAAGELGGVIRSLYDTAALSGKTCRLVFEMPDPKNEEGETTYRAECAAGAITTQKDRDLQLREEEREEERKSKDATRLTNRPGLQDLSAQEKERVEQAAAFSGFTNEEISDRTLPSSVKLEVWTRHQRNPVKSGKAYLYFFPQGFTEKAQIYLRQGNNVWTLKVSPLTGKTSVVAEELEVPRT